MSDANPYRAMANRIPEVGTSENACFDVKVDLCADSVEDEDDVEGAPKEILDLVDRHERKSQPNIDSPLEVNLGTESEPKMVSVGAKLNRDLKNQIITLLNEFKDVFAWSYEDMPGLNTDIVVHHLPLRHECRPVKQKLRRMKPEWTMKVKEEVVKQLDAGFLEVTEYPEWLAI